MNDTWNLHGSKRRPHDDWSRLHELTHDWSAAWTDNDGFHINPMPAAPPTTTHLWAWTTGQWLRVRIDVPHWWAAMLTTENPAIDKSWTTQAIQAPRIDTVLHWCPDDKRVKQHRGSHDARGGKVVQLLPNRATTAPFIGLPDSLPTKLQHLLGALNQPPASTTNPDRHR